jgi:hypothetical protein
VLLSLRKVKCVFERGRCAACWGEPIAADMFPVFQGVCKASATTRLVGGYCGARWWISRGGRTAR